MTKPVTRTMKMKVLGVSRLQFVVDCAVTAFVVAIVAVRVGTNVKVVVRPIGFVKNFVRVFKEDYD